MAGVALLEAKEITDLEIARKSCLFRKTGVWCEMKKRGLCGRCFSPTTECGYYFAGKLQPFEKDDGK